VSGNTPTNARSEATGLGPLRTDHEFTHLASAGVEDTRSQIGTTLVTELAVMNTPFGHFTHGYIGTHGLPSGSDDRTVDGTLGVSTVPTELVVVGSSSGLTTVPTELVVVDGRYSLSATSRVSSTSTTAEVVVSSIGMQPPIRRKTTSAPSMRFATDERPEATRRCCG
jgi:hypothetical protein